MKEEPKRLAPTSPTIRELFLKSGNQCAFDDCQNLIIDNEGNYIGELCHIEAALPGGERFNELQSNEDRRHFSNLLLMCHEHHIVTNNTDIWTTPKLQELKKKHESKFTNVDRKIIDTLTDYTKTIEIHFPKNLKRICRVLDWRNTEQELNETIPKISKFAQAIKRIPLKTRSVLIIILERSFGRGSYLQFSPIEIEEACQIDATELKRHLSIIDKESMLQTGDEDEFGNPIFDLRSPIAWNFWEDLKNFCQTENIELNEILYDLNFELLDE